ncbi:hypothetical protein TSUD_383900 [Trifolium subterraneum]|uniref:DYW domain-containing protein n=1 Tax=Trifolium subterraneum TaxID=3900 RepID=A0A2Z6MTS3_TRISU|nr:hypothetical protein TSUD_383900 [Trifolium subterraneum]
MSYANNVFTLLHNPNVFTWNTMIRGYAESDNNSTPALSLYRKMLVSCVQPDTHTYPFLLKAISKSLNVREGEMIHSDVYALLEKITELLKLEGYVPHTENVLADIEEEEKEQALSYHSEKVAIAFMLLNTAPGTPIRVVKNLRVCADCHMAIKLISKVYDREIVIRDRSRFHHFRGGSCSCKDYWEGEMAEDFANLQSFSVNTLYCRDQPIQAPSSSHG